MLDTSQNLPAGLRKLSEIVAEYDAKRNSIGEAIATFDTAVGAMETASCIGGAYGGDIWGRGKPGTHAATLESALLKSAWRHVMHGLQIKEVATARDLSALETSMTNPPPFTLDKIRATFGKYLRDPRHHMLRGVAEAFCDLDPAYRSHSKVKIGVSGLPKRIIISGAVMEYGGSWREGQLCNVLDAMAALNAQPKMTYSEFSALRQSALRGDDPEFLGITIRGFQNGNAHLLFDRDSLRQINLALAEFYGDVLPDTPEENPRRAPGTAVAADLQYYPTPATVARDVLRSLAFRAGESVLEPSCGDGRLMDELRQINRNLHITGVECHGGRAEMALAKGHHVQIANFLQIAPQATFDKVVMNPPFYGRHYLKHIRHALQFLKPGGTLLSILPASAHYDHGELPKGEWCDLPPGSFSESGTNVPTGYFICRKGES